MPPAEHTVAAARACMLSAIAPLGSETVPLGAAAGRTLAERISAARPQPPFRSAAMDGYGIGAADLGCGTLTVLGEAAAGRPYAGEAPRAGGAVRIFTGAPVPAGVDLIVPQERAHRVGNAVRLEAGPRPRSNIREAGVDFAAHAVLAEPGLRLNARQVALLAAAGVGAVRVARRPRVAVLATGDEVVEPGQPVSPHQIYDSVSFGVAAAIAEWGGEAVPLPIRPDFEAAIAATAAAALGETDLLVVVGGASGGDYDLVKRSLGRLSLAIAVERIAVRPGKPTWFGRADGQPVLGLPGNPAAALVCAQLFLRPLMQAFLGGPTELPRATALLQAELPPNGPSESYLRAVATHGGDARLTVRACDNQDTSLVSVFAAANALIVRPPAASAAPRGAPVEVLWL